MCRLARSGFPVHAGTKPARGFQGVVRNIEVGLARGPLRPLLPMRLDINRWSPPFARTALELIPGRRVRPSAAYFRSGHHLLDSLTYSLLQHSPAQRFQCVPAVDC